MPWRDEPSWARRWSYRLLPVGAVFTVAAFSLAAYVAINSVKTNAENVRRADQARADTCDVVDTFIKSSIVYRDGLNITTFSSVEVRAAAWRDTVELLKALRQSDTRLPLSLARVWEQKVRSEAVLHRTVNQDQQQALDQSQRAVERWGQIAKRLNCGRETP